MVWKRDVGKSRRLADVRDIEKAIGRSLPGHESALEWSATLKLAALAWSRLGGATKAFRAGISFSGNLFGNQYTNGISFRVRPAYSSNAGP
jgi:hypothetical protein